MMRILILLIVLFLACSCAPSKVVVKKCEKTFNYDLYVCDPL
jgi:hypothetical protein